MHLPRDSRTSTHLKICSALPALALAGFACCLSCLVLVGESRGQEGHGALSPIVFCQYSSREDIRAVPAKKHPGPSRIVILNGDGTTSVLTKDFVCARDPDVSFDGRSVLFAGRPRAGDRWSIYEIVLAGRQARISSSIDGVPQPPFTPGQPPAGGPTADGVAQLPATPPAAALQASGTSPSADGVVIPPGSSGTQGSYAASGARAELGSSGGITIRQVIGLPEDCVDPLYLQDGRILFSGFVSGARSGEAALFACRPDGSELQRLTHHPGFDLGASLLGDGRVMFVNWTRSSQVSTTAVWTTRLFTMNSDGTAVTAIDGGTAVSDARQTYDRRIVSVAYSRSSFEGAGPLGALSMRRIAPREGLAGDVAGSFLSPFPLPGGDIVVAYSGAASQATYGLFRLASGAERLAPIYDDPSWHDTDPGVVMPRAIPMGHLSIVDNRKTTGVLYCLDTTFPGGGEAAARVRVTSISDRRVARTLGEAPIEADGSFAIEVPADLPLSLNLLGKDGRPVGLSSQWIWVRPNETRGCVGCHESRDVAPENRRPLALTKPPVGLARVK